jgi:hypothetical protein
MAALPNIGIELGMEELVNEELEVEIMVTKATGHWKMIWTVATSAEGNGVHRQLHTVREVGYDHLTNWGPYTATAGFEALIAPRIFVKKMTYSERRALEEIVVRTQAMVPDGVWDCKT